MNAGSSREPVGPEALDPPDFDDRVIPVFIPPLITLLWASENKQGAPLSEAQVLAIRGGAVCMMMRLSMARKLAESRGYDDVDPDDVWRQWQAARLQLANDGRA